MVWSGLASRVVLRGDAGRPGGPGPLPKPELAVPPPPPAVPDPGATAVSPLAKRSPAPASLPPPSARAVGANGGVGSDLVISVGFVSTGLTGSSLGKAAGDGIGLGWIISFLAGGFDSLAFSTLGGGGGGFLISGGVSTFSIGLYCSWCGTSTRLIGRKS